jgi:3-mercaptopyruvate sulfurtransferase SseA
MRRLSGSAPLAAVALILPLLAAAPRAQDEAGVPRMSQAEFKTAAEAGTILIVDVRDEASYANGHIPGAVLAPLGDLAQHVAALKAARKPIVTYCA